MDEESNGAWWSNTRENKEDDHHAGTLEGFYFWFLANSNSKQMRLFKFAIGRLAKQHPDEDPRTVIVEFFAEAVHRYEQHKRHTSKGKQSVKRKYSKELLRATETVLAERSDKLTRQLTRELGEHSEGETSQRESCVRLSSTHHRGIRISLKLGDQG